MMFKPRHSFGDFLQGVIVGGSLGAVTALLFGTEKGRKIKKELMHKYKILGRKAVHVRDDLIRAAKSPAAQKIKQRVIKAARSPAARKLKRSVAKALQAKATRKVRRKRRHTRRTHR